MGVKGPSSNGDELKDMIAAKSLVRCCKVCTKWMQKMVVGNSRRKGYRRWAESAGVHSVYYTFCAAKAHGKS